MPRSVLRVGTRTSPLALTQAEAVRQLISTVITHRSFELVPLTTAGDRGEGTPANKGEWVEELQMALIGGKVDLIVHSAKDLPIESIKGVVLASTPKREDPRDALLSRSGKGVAGLPIGATIGTSSMRRTSQLRAMNRGFNPVDLRGNIDTRIAAMQDAKVDAVVLAVAGMKRLLRKLPANAEVLGIDVMLPAPGQGALAIECRATDRNMRAGLAKIQDEPTRAAVDAERAFVAALGGDCGLPLAALGELRDDMLRLRGLVASVDGVTVITDQVEHSDPEKAGFELAERLKDKGALELLAT